MKRIKIRYGETIINAIPLAKFKMKLGKLVATQHSFMFLKWYPSRYEVEYEIKPKWLVFIPWKHCAKEIALIDDADVLPQDFSTPTQWIDIDKFVSPYTYEDPYYDEYEITDFSGYPFVAENESFIANVWQSDTSSVLEFLFKHFPELLEAADAED